MRFNIRPRVLSLLLISLLVPRSRADDASRMLLKHSEPTYPELARQMHLGGTVLLRISIEADGHVSKVKTVTGHPLLAGAAESAVREWKYAPAPEATEGTVQVNFKSR